MADTSAPSPPTPHASARYALAALCFAGLNIALVFGYLGRRQFLLNPVWIYITGYVLAFFWYAYAGARIMPALARVPARVVVPIILAFACLFRMVVLPASPSLSTDMYRYVWDGRLTLQGINPYRWTPNAQTLRGLRDPLWQQMEYKPYQTIYMPVSQGIFALANKAFGSNLLGYKLLYVLFDLGVIALLLRLLAWLKRPLAQVIWYAWCPLPVTEVALAGHQDIVGVFFLLLALDLLLRRRAVVWGALVLAASILTKGFALLLVPLFVRNYGHRFAVAVGLALLYLGLPMWVYLPMFLHGMKQYLDNVHANAGIFNWINLALAHVSRRHHFDITEKLSDLVIGAAALGAAWKPAPTDDSLVRRTFVVLALALLVIPTLFPWYLIWPLALMPLLGRRPSYAFVLLTGLSVLLYTYYISIKAYWWAPVAEYGPFYAALALEYALWRRARRPPFEKTLRMTRQSSRLQPDPQMSSFPAQALPPQASSHN